MKKIFKKKNALKFIIILGSIILGALIATITLRQQIKNTEGNHFHEHADFAFFIDGKPFNFSDYKYMSVMPCSMNPSDHIVFEDMLLEDSVHLHNNDGGVIHVHKPGITFNDFFESLDMEFNDTAFKDADGNIFESTNQKAFKFIVNGEEVESLATREIRNLDRVLISYGAINRDSKSLLSEYGSISNKACIASENCTHREPAAPENCSQTPKPFLLRMIGL